MDSPGGHGTARLGCHACGPCRAFLCYFGDPAGVTPGAGAVPGVSFVARSAPRLAVQVAPRLAVVQTPGLAVAEAPRLPAGVAPRLAVQGDGHGVDARRHVRSFRRGGDRTSRPVAGPASD